jgi:hypothetical protein
MLESEKDMRLRLWGHPICVLSSINFKYFLFKLNQLVKDIDVFQTYLSYLFNSFVFGGSVDIRLNLIRGYN